MEIDILARQFFDYSHFIRGYSKETVRRYRQALMPYVRHAGISRIEEVTEESVRRYFMYGSVERGWKPNTYIMFCRSLLVFFRWCVANGHLASNPAESLELPKVGKSLPRKLTRQEALRLLDVAYNYPYGYRYLRYRNQAIFATFIYAGLRRAELLGLRYADVDVENLTIFVRHGKGAKDRIVPMSHALAHILRAYLVERARLNKTCPEFFASLNRDTGFTLNGLKRLVDLVRKSSKIPFSVHRLRHTFATLMLEGGCDIYSLSKMMGHSDISTTTIYLAASAEHLRAQMMKHPLNHAAQ